MLGVLDQDQDQLAGLFSSIFYIPPHTLAHTATHTPTHTWDDNSKWRIQNITVRNTNDANNVSDAN